MEHYDYDFGDLGHLDLRLTDSTRFDDEGCESGLREQVKGLTNSLRQPSEVPTVGHRADEDVLVLSVSLHADAITQQRPAGDRAGGIHDDHPGTGSVFSQAAYELIDKGALPDSRRPGDTDDVRSGLQSGRRGRPLYGLGDASRKITSPPGHWDQAKRL